MPVFNRKPFDPVSFLKYGDLPKIEELINEMQEDEWINTRARDIYLLSLDRYADYLTAHCKDRVRRYMDDDPMIREFISYLDLLMYEFPEIELGYAIIDKESKGLSGYTVGSSFCPRCFYEMVEHWRHNHNIEHVGHIAVELHDNGKIH